MSKKKAQIIGLEVEEKECILPKAISLQDWSELLGTEDSASVVAWAVNEIILSGLKEIETREYDRRIPTHLAHRLKHTLNFIVEESFIKADVGEGNTQFNPTWRFDEEPTPAPLDSWARGALVTSGMKESKYSVPALPRLFTPQTTVEREHDIKKQELQITAHTQNQEKIRASFSVPAPIQSAKSTPKPPAVPKPTKEKPQTPQQAPQSASSEKAKIILRKPTAEAAPERPSTDPQARTVVDAEAREKAAIARLVKETGATSFVYDAEQLIPVVKVDPSTLPSRRVKPTISVSDSKVPGKTLPTPPDATNKPQVVVLKRASSNGAQRGATQRPQLNSLHPIPPIGSSSQTTGGN